MIGSVFKISVRRPVTRGEEREAGAERRVETTRGGFCAVIERSAEVVEVVVGSERRVVRRRAGSECCSRVGQKVAIRSAAKEVVGGCVRRSWVERERGLERVEGVVEGWCIRRERRRRTERGTSLIVESSGGMA